MPELLEELLLELDELLGIWEELDELLEGRAELLLELEEQQDEKFYCSWCEAI